jgi:spermidine synthase
MISALLFMAEPRSVLLIGLGGCSLVHFLRAAFPTCSIYVVEIREAVIDLAHDFFLLPQGNPHLRVFHVSGQDFIMNKEWAGGL